MATMGLILIRAFPFKILFNSFVSPQIFREHLLGTMKGTREHMNNGEPPSYKK